MILVVTPLRAENDLLAAALLEHGLRGEIEPAGRLQIRRYDGLAIGRGGHGKAQLALRTGHLLDHVAGVDTVVVAGAAGALDGHLAIGDVVVGTATVEHDYRLAASPKRPRFKRTVDAPLPDGTPEGVIASGDEDVVTPDRSAAIRELTGARAVAWEGAGGARAAALHGCRFAEVRGITDHADTALLEHFEANLPGAMARIAALLAVWPPRSA